MLNTNKKYKYTSFNLINYNELNMISGVYFVSKFKVNETSSNLS